MLLWSECRRQEDVAVWAANVDCATARGIARAWSRSEACADYRCEVSVFSCRYSGSTETAETTRCTSSTDPRQLLEFVVSG